MIEKVITDSSTEKIVVKWDGERFALIRIIKEPALATMCSIAILNPKEMLDLVKFAANLGGD